MQLTRTCTPVLKDKIDFIFFKGITFRNTFTFKNANNTPISLSNAIVTFHLLEKNQTVENITVSTNSAPSVNYSLTVTDVPNGKAELIITSQYTSLISYRNAYWWVTLTLPNGDILRKDRGEIFVKNPYQ